MVDRTALEMRRTGNRTGGSNPSLSASHVHTKHSPLAFERAQKPNNGGPSRENLRTAMTPLRPEILSLRPFVSKAPDFADLVRNL